MPGRRLRELKDLAQEVTVASCALEDQIADESITRLSEANSFMFQKLLVVLFILILNIHYDFEDFDQNLNNLEKLGRI